MRRRFYAAIALCCFAPYLWGAQLAIIIDDIGYNGPQGRRAVDLDGAFTLAILPFTPHTHELAQRAHARGKEIMLHAPMSNTRDIPLGKGGLTSGMTHDQFVKTLHASLADIPYLSGVNNHMGSRLTRESEPMGWLMQELVKRHLYFIDSRTSAKSQALTVARAYGVPSLKRDIFLDNERDHDHIREQLLKAIHQAKRQGSAIAIGHPYPQTLDVLEQAQPLLDRYDVELVPVSDLLRRHSHLFINTGTSCLAPPQKIWMRPSAPLHAVTVQSILKDVVEFLVISSNR